MCIRDSGYFTLAMFPCPELAVVLDLPWLAVYKTNAQMYEHRDEIHERLSKVFAGQSRDHWLTVLAGAGVWCAAVLRYEDLETDPQIAHKDIFWDVPVGPDGQTFRTVASPFVFSETPPRMYMGVPRVGQHTSDYWPEASAG